MRERHGFVSAGCWALDHVKLIQHWPAEEELSYIASTEQQGGGSAHNFGIDIKKLDPRMPVQAIGLLGNDAAGDFLFTQATSLNIDTQQLHRTSQSGTSFTDVLSVIETGRRTFFHFPGCNDLISPEHFNFTQSNSKWLHLGLPGVHKILDSPWQSDANGWVTVLKNAQAAGLKTNIEMVSISAERNRAILLPCLPYLDCLIVNDHEIGSLARLPTLRDGVSCQDTCLQAAHIVLEKGMQQGGMQLVVVHFPTGAICVTAQGEELIVRSHSVDAQTIVSAVGAGDAFAAGMLYALHEDWSLTDALNLAHATAAASLRSATTVGAVEDVDTVLALAGLSRPDTPSEKNDNLPA